jgi:hypothetical protein
MKRSVMPGLRLWKSAETSAIERTLEFIDGFIKG